MFPVNRRSLRVRLLAWLSGIALVVTGTTWLLHGILLEDLARDFLGERLEREARYAVEQLQQGGVSTPAVLETASRGSQIFHHLYVLRFAGNVSASDKRWQSALAPLLNQRNEAHVEVSQNGQHLLVYRQPFVLEGKSGVLLVGEDFSRVEQGLSQLHWWVAGISAVLLVLLITLNLFAVNRALIPLSRLRRQLEQLQLGRRDRLSSDVPAELDGLTSQLNRFMDEIDSRLQRSRDSVANLSHALKTPLAAVTQVLRGSRPIDEARRQKLVERLEEIHALLDSELRRSRIAGPHAGRMSLPHRDASRLIDMFRSLYPDKTFRLDTQADKEARVPVESQDFSEMLGILLDNAGKWAHRDVTCRLTVTDALRIRVADDGPGISEQYLPHLGQRGMRLDEQHPGYGLGLSILDQLVTRYAGKTQFNAGAAGGLDVQVTIPVADGVD
ncbi:hypothetical protein GCM10022228_17550 [Halomonas cibimaris]|uniref:histidine kinase n=1 Tax=Halomonas cibimaris TaxID=657012 RepID=A0ABP7LUI5_9GAMM